MKLTYEAKVISFTVVHQLPDSWGDDDFREILERADFDGWEKIDPAELREYAIMALQEFEADEAGELVLSYKLDDKLNKGQIQNLAHEMMDEKLWEEYTDITLHKKLYDCAVLLLWAFPSKFPQTNAIKCIIEVVSAKPGSLPRITKAFLARLLASGMDDHAVINRLFEDQVAGAPFPESEGIIWQFESTPAPDKLLITIYSSNYWLRPIDKVGYGFSGEFLEH